MKTEKNKEFHAVEFQREQRTRIYEIIKDMSFEERTKYFKQFRKKFGIEPLVVGNTESKQQAIAEPNTKYGKK